MICFRYAALPATLVLFTVLGAPGVALEPDDLEALRVEALEQVNQVRQDQGLPALETSQALSDAAQAHAVDMIEEDYYAHIAPDGTAPMDRFLEHGGVRWRVVRENIARCSNCPVPPTLDRVQSFQQGWMDSPEHRDNILAKGLDSFGFGIAGEGDEVVAVQTFSGPGTPRGLQAGEEPMVLSPDEFDEQLVDAVNRARRQQDLQPVETSAALTQVAEQLLPESVSSNTVVDEQGQLFDLLPQGEGGAWTQMDVLAAACGGCGAEATVQDINHFIEQWIGNPQYSSILFANSVAAIGFAMRVNGEGRKVGIAVAGQ